MEILSTSIKLPVSDAALPTTEGRSAWRNTRKFEAIYDGVRERAKTTVGWQHVAFPILGPQSVANTNNLVANGGTIVVPMLLIGHMLLRSISWRNADTTLARSMEWRLYEDRNNASNSVDEIAGANGSESFTATAASTRPVAATGAPVYLGPGVYWMAVRNTHATQTLGVNVSGTFTMTPNVAQTKTLGSSLGSTLDLVAATWTKLTATCPIFELHGSVLNQSTVY
jgi:hypothetical protein